VGLENAAPENAGLENEGPWLFHWKCCFLVVYVTLHNLLSDELFLMFYKLILLRFYFIAICTRFRFCVWPHVFT